MIYTSPLRYNLLQPSSEIDKIIDHRNEVDLDFMVQDMKIVVDECP